MSWLEIGLAILSVVSSLGAIVFGVKGAVVAKIADHLISEIENNPYLAGSLREKVKGHIQRSARAGGVEPALNARVKAATE